MVAAALAVLAALLLLTATRAPAPAPVRPQTPPTPAPAAGEVAAPVRLADPALADLLHPGGRVDVLAVAESPTGPAEARAPAETVAEAVRVLDVPRVAAAQGTTGGTLVVLAVTPAQARDLASAQATGRLSVTLLR
jgi:pilus assembly protein CpaB